jgi:uncharacterized protein
MSDFQRSLTRFMYFALIVAAVLTAWGLHASPRRTISGNADAGYGGYRSGSKGVSATGTCVVRSKPDLAEVTIGVSQSASSATSANSYIKSTVRKITSVLTAGGVNAKDIQTQEFHLRSIWDSGRNWEAKKWNGEEMLRVRLRDLNKVPELLDGAIKAGANRIGSLSYTVDDVNKLRERGRATASKVARRKAQQLASGLGGTLGKLISCNEGYPESRPYYGNWNYMDGNMALASRAQANMQITTPSSDESEQEELTIQPGEYVMTVVVTANYELD